jgi:hypothetical protein
MVRIEFPIVYRGTITTPARAGTGQSPSFAAGDTFLMTSERSLAREWIPDTFRVLRGLW